VQARHLIDLKVRQHLGEPLPIRAPRQPSDERSSVSFGPREGVEQLAGTYLADPATIRWPIACKASPIGQSLILLKGPHQESSQLLLVHHQV
jgi:hypothetical protein